MNTSGAWMIIGILAAIALVPFGIGWRFRQHRDGVMSTIFFGVAAGVFVFPLVQWFVVRPMNDRHIAKLVARATVAQLAGRDYPFVVETLGVPDHIRHVN